MASPDELWLVDFGESFPGEPAHHRPALVIGPPDTVGADFPFVIVCPLTTVDRGRSLHVEVEPTPASGLDEHGHVQCELVRSVNRRWLVHQLGAVDIDTTPMSNTSCAHSADTERSSHPRWSSPRARVRAQLMALPSIERDHRAGRCGTIGRWSSSGPVGCHVGWNGKPGADGAHGRSGVCTSRAGSTS
jgi:mRNA-degrading endonuclease toxin of MazEF toxin-antitoxin module